MENMAAHFFSPLSGPPANDDLGFNQENITGNAFDGLIRGWTKYWNEVLQPDIPLNPNLVKALIATESGFNPVADTKSKGPGRARGLMQLTDATRKILQDEGGELFEHLLTLTDKDAYQPNLNIAAGIRWLFHKRYLASKKYKRSIDWLETALEYKNLLRLPRNAHERKKFPEVRRTLIEMVERLGGGT